MAATNLPLIATLGIASSSLASGAGLCFSLGGIPPLVRHSGHSSGSVDLTLRQWYHMYSIGAATMPPLAIATTLLYGCASYLSYSHHSLPSSPASSIGGGLGGVMAPWQAFAAAGALTVAIVPFTFIVIFPVNGQLEAGMKVKEEGSGAGAGAGAGAKALSRERMVELLEQWKWLNIARASLPLVGTACGVWALINVI